MTRHSRLTVFMPPQIVAPAVANERRAMPAQPPLELPAFHLPGLSSDQGAKATADDRDPESQAIEWSGRTRAGIGEIVERSDHVRAGFLARAALRDRSGLLGDVRHEPPIAGVLDMDRQMLV